MSYREEYGDTSDVHKSIEHPGITFRNYLNATHQGAILTSTIVLGFVGNYNEQARVFFGRMARI